MNQQTELHQSTPKEQGLSVNPDAKIDTSPALTIHPASAGINSKITGGSISRVTPPTPVKVSLRSSR
ncbi:hypothetical protein C922_05671 [Plasmodium inui San Antonio 1]|uniref:Uncharacterized protein n=1 Tax=Plasmodium inui San Antonio 1 TaxID=1237626 RepID=W7AF84_9APIC|nr:hypothetical protein C922_05671 [Plasmodium inui San Antonio 1]EUD63951.1 hypothetical protein C922_05671 [Plasmodium inui San Antonio 1]